MAMKADNSKKTLNSNEGCRLGFGRAQSEAAPRIFEL